MAHLRKRHILTRLEKEAKYWPVVGVLGLRQSGKSTLFRDLLELPNQLTLDDEAVLDDVRLSAKNFLAKHPTPLVIDEAQKSSTLFDAIKLKVDHKKIPGSYYLTGSSQFSSKIGIRESLTGRISLLQLYPFTISEAHAVAFEAERSQPIHAKKIRFKVEQLLEQFTKGGLPVPLFTRDEINKKNYFNSWLETTIIRDASRAFGPGYDPDISWSILRQMGQALKEGEMPSLGHFKQDSRRLRKYLQAMADIFLIKKIPCHENGQGKDVWLPTDSGIATEIMGTAIGEGATLSMARVSILNEILSNCEYAANPIHPTYYKSARGSPIDLIWNNTAIKITAEKKSRWAYEERALEGCLKKVGLKRAILCIPEDETNIPKSGIGVAPWTYWS